MSLAAFFCEEQSSVSFLGGRDHVWGSPVAAHRAAFVFSHVSGTGLGVSRAGIVP